MCIHTGLVVHVVVDSDVCSRVCKRLHFVGEGCSLCVDLAGCRWGAMGLSMPSDPWNNVMVSVMMDWVSGSAMVIVVADL